MYQIIHTYIYVYMYLATNLLHLVSVISYIGRTAANTHMFAFGLRQVQAYLKNCLPVDGIGPCSAWIEHSNQTANFIPDVPYSSLSETCKCIREILLGEAEDSYAALCFQVMLRPCQGQEMSLAGLFKRFAEAVGLSKYHCI